MGQDKGQGTKIQVQSFFRRISELREQSSLEQQAKQHLEEELRAELEEKQHIINTLKTKVVSGTN